MVKTIPSKQEKNENLKKNVDADLSSFIRELE